MNQPIEIPVSSSLEQKLDNLLRNLELKNADDIFFKIILSEEKRLYPFHQTLRQITIFNPTTRVVKLGVGDVDTTHYEFVVNAQKLCVLPPFLFNEITVLQDTFTAASINPIMVVSNIILTPGNYAIT